MNQFSENTTSVPAGTGMRSICSIYKIGRGPSSSHTMGPEKAALLFHDRYPDADFYTVKLYGSLALTGKGHGTDRILAQTLPKGKCEVIFCPGVTGLPHPNTMDFYAKKNGAEIGFLRVFSIGGGDILLDGEDAIAEAEVYPHRHFSDIAEYCRKRGIRLPEYADEVEGKSLARHLPLVWETMKSAVSNGLAGTGELPGGLHVQRKAGYLYHQNPKNEDAVTRENRLICAYAFAVSEENAANGRIVTAPTCGSCGILPAVLLYEQQTSGKTDEEICRALKVAGLIGNIIRTNASISGAECGCQAEVGSACSMAAAALAELYGMRIDQIEYAAEVAMEHHLGLTCDPIGGLVQIPCIERNAVAAMRAINAVNLANFLTDTRKISFDLVVDTMYETGKDLSRSYKETSEGGLAKLYH